MTARTAAKGHSVLKQTDFEHGEVFPNIHHEKTYNESVLPLTNSKWAVLDDDNPGWTSQVTRSHLWGISSPQGSAPRDTHLQVGSEQNDGRPILSVHASEFQSFFGLDLRFVDLRDVKQTVWIEACSRKQFFSKRRGFPATFHQKTYQYLVLKLLKRPSSGRKKIAQMPRHEN